MSEAPKALEEQIQEWKDALKNNHELRAWYAKELRKKNNDTHAVNLRVPIQLYKKIKNIADENHITVSGLIFNILDEVLYQSKVKNVDILQIQKTHKSRVSRVVSKVLQDCPESGTELRPGGGTGDHVNDDPDQSSS